MSERVINRQETTNEHGQRTITGQIRLTKTAVLLSTVESGKPESITLYSGALVDYRRQETRTGAYDTISMFAYGQLFSLTIKVNDTNYGR